MMAQTMLGRLLAVVLSLMMAGVAVPVAQASTHAADPADVAERVLSQERLRAEQVALFQAALDLPEVRAQARSMGVDAARLRAAIPHLTDAELAELALRAERVADVTAGHRRERTRRSRNPFYPHGTACLLLTGVALVAVGLALLAVAADDY